MRYLIQFENGKEVITDDNSYITIITFEKMFNSAVMSCTLIY